MRFHYNIYSSARKKLREGGIVERVERLKKSKDGLHFIGGYVSAGDMVRTVTALKEAGYYDHLPKAINGCYKSTMNAILQEPKSHAWQVKRPEGLVKEACDIDDLLLFSGDIASLVLGKKDIWRPKKFGFESATGLVGVVSAYIMEQSHGRPFREGYTWMRKGEGGAKIVTEITGDNNCDLRVSQTDVAPYETIDPFGFPIEMRPELNVDGGMLAPYHSTEGTLFVAMMHYTEQQGIEAAYRKDKGKALIAYARSLGQGGGMCAEHFGGFDTDPCVFFTFFDHRIPVLGSEGLAPAGQQGAGQDAVRQANYHLITESRGSYGLRIAQNGDLVFCRDGERDDVVKTAGVRFTPKDVDPVLTGLIYQSARGLGRTSARQLMSLVTYRYSDAFEKDQAWLRNGCKGLMPSLENNKQ
jgi:hypothetical protein